MCNTAPSGVSAHEASSGNYGRPRVESCINHVTVAGVFVKGVFVKSAVKRFWEVTINTRPKKNDRHVKTFIFNFDICSWCPPSFVVFSRNIEEWWQYILKVFHQNLQDSGMLAVNGPGLICSCASSPPQEAFVKPQKGFPEFCGFVYFPDSPHRWSPHFNLVLEKIVLHSYHRNYRIPW